MVWVSLQEIWEITENGNSYEKNDFNITILHSLALRLVEQCMASQGNGEDC